MMLLSMKTYLALLWGISILFGMVNTAEPEKTTKQITSVHVRHTETHKPTGVGDAPADTTVEVKIVTDRSGSSGLVAMNTVSATAISSGPQLLHISTAVTTTAGAAHPLHNTTISEIPKPSEETIHQQSPITSNNTNVPATASATSWTTVAVSSPQPPSTHKLEVTSELSSTTSPAESAPVFTQTLSSPSASPSTMTTANPASEADVTTSETAPTNTELSSTYQPVSVTKNISTSHLPDTTTTNSFSTKSTISTTNVSTTNTSTTNVSTTNTSTTNVSTTNTSTTNVSTTIVSTTNVSTTNTSIVPPYVPKRVPSPTTKSTPATTKAPCEVSKSPSSTEVQPCSTRGLVKPCLIAIASMAVLATIFMVSTIILCTKLSIRKYKVKKPQPSTEMMCISALLPESYTYSRQRNAVSNGVLVMHGGTDSDEDEGDNLTLSSFLPENDRFV